MVIANTNAQTKTTAICRPTFCVFVNLCLQFVCSLPVVLLTFTLDDLITFSCQAKRVSMWGGCPRAFPVAAGCRVIFVAFLLLYARRRVGTYSRNIYFAPSRPACVIYILYIKAAIGGCQPPFGFFRHTFINLSLCLRIVKICYRKITPRLVACAVALTRMCELAVMLSGKVIALPVAPKGQ